MQRRVNVVEKVPYMTDDDAAYFVLGYAAVQHETKGHQDPWEIRGREYE